MNRVARIQVAGGLAGLLFILFGAVTWLSTIAAQAAIEPVPGGGSPYGTSSSPLRRMAPFTPPMALPAIRSCG